MSSTLSEADVGDQIDARDDCKRVVFQMRVCPLIVPYIKRFVFVHGIKDMRPISNGFWLVKDFL